MIIDPLSYSPASPQASFLPRALAHRRESHPSLTKRFFALALATFLGLGLLSTSFAAFAQDAYGGITNWRGGYGSTGGYQAYTR
ncbi:MAG TPA: hypothetical protein VM715_20215 [Candidatus Acidoferrum sp.]|nr:hypothetical protein [Candidatus Acidoferrum sp.]